jgi:signal recognition particle subunit SRP54
VFDTLSDRLSATFRTLRGKGRLSDADIDETLREIRIALLEADVSLVVVKDFIAAIRERAKAEDLSKSLNPAQQIVKIVNDELVSILGGETRLLRFAKKPPTIIMLAGLQGAGKTTLAGKLAVWLKAQGHTPLLVAADLQRPNAVNQLQVVAKQAGVAAYAPQPGNGVGDPVQVARESVQVAERHLHDVLIVDTAGRLGVDEELMKQAADIKAAVNPDEVLFVVDAMIGQDAVNTAKAFETGVGFDGVVLTKLDGDARGGAALSIARVIGKPIMFASNGEKLVDFDLFHPDRMAGRILDMGDMLTLIEQAERHLDKEESTKAANKLLGLGGGEFGLQDFLGQMQAVRRMGPLSKVFGMLPGMGQMRDQLDSIDETQIDRIEAIIHSMTPGERANVSILNGSRRARIAKGAGVEVSEVNNLVTRFVEARKMMQSMGGMMTGAAGAAGRKGRQAPAAKKKGRGVSGNPAKRNVAAVEAKPTVTPDPSVFGAGGMPTSEAELAEAMKGFQLPPEMQQFLTPKNKGPQR